MRDDKAATKSVRHEEITKGFYAMQHIRETSCLGVFVAVMLAQFRDVATKTRNLKESRRI